MRNGPNKWTMADITNQFRTGDGCWAEVRGGWHEPARPIGPSWFKWRIKMAWAVFTGRADALFFPNQEQP